MSRSRYKIHETEYPYFLTCTIVGWLPIFSRPETFKIITDSLTFLQRQGRLSLFGYVILENHLHLVVSSPNLSTDIGDFKSYTAHQLIHYLEEKNVELFLRQFKYYKKRFKKDRDYQVWQEGSHPQQIQNGEMMQQKLEYTHLNPVKRGFVDEAIHWRHSSARNYAGMEGIVPVITDWLF